MPILDTRTILKGALVLVAALAWNDAAKKTIDYLFPIERDSGGKSAAIAMVVYAIFVTLLIIVIITIYNYTTVRLASDSFTKRKMKKIAKYDSVRDYSSQLPQ